MEFKLAFFIIAALWISGCSSPAATTPPTKQTSSPTPNFALAKDQAIKEFLVKTYSGWQMQGAASGPDPDCDEIDPCNVHIIKGKESKVLLLIVREFTRPDGSTYWLAFEAKPADLAKVKLEKIKERTRENERDTIRSMAEDAETADVDQSYDPRN